MCNHFFYPAYFLPFNHSAAEPIGQWNIGLSKTKLHLIWIACKRSSYSFPCLVNSVPLASLRTLELLKFEPFDRNILTHPCFRYSRVSVGQWNFEFLTCSSNDCRKVNPFPFPCRWNDDKTFDLGTYLENHPLDALKYSNHKLWAIMLPRSWIDVF